MRSFLFFALLASLAACTRPPPPNEPIDIDGPVDCGKEHFKSKEHCFEHAKAACDWLKCEHGCDILGARSSKMVVCSFNEVSSSKLTKCAGYSGWLCPEDMKCVLSAEAERADDATGECVSVGETTRP